MERASPVTLEWSRWFPGPSESLRRIRGHGLRTWLRRERQPVIDTFKTAIAATTAWIVAEHVLSRHDPILAPLAALLTVQVTTKGTLVRGAQQVVGVVAGVLVVTGLVHYVGLHAWSLGVVIFASLLLGRGLRLGSQANQVATSGLLVLSLGSGYGADRVFDTLIGAGVGMAVSVLTPSRRNLNATGEALAGLANDLADLLADIASGLSSAPTSGSARVEWLHRARSLNPEVTGELDAFSSAEYGARLLPTRFRDNARLLQYGHAGKAEAHTVGHVESLAAALRDQTEVPAIASPSPETVPPSLPDLLRSLSSALSSFAYLQRAPSDQAEQRGREPREALTRAAAVQTEAEGQLRIGTSIGNIESAILTATAAMRLELDPDSGRHVGCCPPLHEG